MSEPQYTPRDILAFGQRAEAEGRYAYAYQIYAHLAQYYSADESGAVARAGLARLQAFQGQAQTAAQSSQQNGAVRPPTQPSRPAAVGAGVQTARQVKPANAQARSATRVSQNSSGTHPVFAPQVRTQQKGAEVAQAHQSKKHLAIAQTSLSLQNEELLDDDELADVRLPFYSGRFTMQLAQFLGWLVLLAGVALLIAEFVGFGVLAQNPRFDWWNYAVPSVLILCGLLLVLVSQIAKASFESANASRQLLLIERSRLGL